MRHMNKESGNTPAEPTRQLRAKAEKPSARIPEPKALRQAADRTDENRFKNPEAVAVLQSDPS
jgi:hypothetical protein